MTIINGIEIDEKYKRLDRTKEAIINNDPLDSILHCVIMVSNPCLYARRYQLAKQFIKRMEDEPNILLYIVEIAYKNQKFYVTDSDCPRHLQLQTDVPLWHKENAINIGIKKLLPDDWKAVAWIDADIEFENAHWALDTLKILNGYCDVVQLFSHASDLDFSENPMRIFQGFGYQHILGKQHGNDGLQFFHPGFAWACTKKAYEKMNKLFEHSILGSGDQNMAMSFIGRGQLSINKNAHISYKKMIDELQKRVRNLRLGYCPGVIRHYYHGSKKNRRYSERWLILIIHQYDPTKHVKKDENGLLIPTEECPKKLLEDIYNYFEERNEDETT